MLLRMALFGAVVLSTACSTWPEHGVGGVAELRGTKLENSQRVIAVNHMLSLAQAEFVSLKRDGLRACLPGSENQIEMMLARSKRELHADMLADAASDLYKLNTVLAEVRCRLTAVKHRTACITAPGTHIHQAVWFQVPDLDSCELNGVLSASDYPYADDLNDRQPPLSLVLDTLFNTDSDTIADAYKFQLDILTDFLVVNTQYEVAVVGHADSRGSDRYNETLSFNRANRVSNYLIDNGLSATRIKVVEGGEYVPRAGNVHPEEQHLNRRVELWLIPTSIHQNNLGKAGASL